MFVTYSVEYVEESGEALIAILMITVTEFSSSSLIPMRTKFDTQTTIISHRRRKRFFYSAGLLFWSTFSDRIADITRFFWDKSILFLNFRRKFRGGKPLF